MKYSILSCREVPFTTCLEQAAAITFPHVMEVAAAACHDMHNGMTDAAMGGDAMGTDAMATDAMAPATK